MRPMKFGLFAVVLLFGSGNELARAADTKPSNATKLLKQSESLLPEDRKLLERSLKEFLFDPQGDKYVAVTMKLRDDSGNDAEGTRHGWLIHGGGRQPDRVYLVHDDSTMILSAGAKIEHLDFTALCRKRYGASRTPEPGNGPVYPPIGDFEAIPDFVNAAWLYRLGEDKLASEALERAREQTRSSGETNGKPSATDSDAAMVADVQEQFAELARQNIIHAFMFSEDEKALAEAQRLLKRYPKQAAQLVEPEVVVADLERRRKKGSFGKRPSEEWPSGYSEWNSSQKLAYLIDSLDEVNAQDWSGSGAADPLHDRRIVALLELGDTVIPTLIDAIENDNRLTRSIFQSFESQPRPILLSVRQAAYVAVMAMLRVRVFKPGVAGRAMTPRMAEDRKQIGGALRAYWKIQSGLPFEKRMMNQLIDANATRDDWRDAAYNLGYPERRRAILVSESGSAEWPADNLDQTETSKRIAAVAKFDHPTAAAAILAAMDRDLAAHEAEPARPDDGTNPFITSLLKQTEDIKRRKIEDAYMLPIKQLRDHRIAPKLATRCAAAKTVRARCQIALAAHLCGDSEPLKQFCRDFEQGKLRLPRINTITAKLKVGGDRMLQQGIQDVFEIIMSLIESHLPEADRALNALADPKHPQNKLVVRILLRSRIADPIHIMPSGDYFSDIDLDRHPYCLAVLRPELDNTEPTGVVYRIKGNEIETSGGGFFGQSPNDLGNPSLTRDQASERICDIAAFEIGLISWGMPRTHPLYKDSTARLTAMKQALDRYQGKFRSPTQDEESALNDSPTLIPIWRQLGRPATATDIAKGQAIFELGGRGKVASLKLPAVGNLASTKDSQDSPKTVLILQAETGADGKTLYGAIGPNIRANAFQFPHFSSFSR